MTTMHAITPAQSRVLDELVRGATATDIAHALGLSINTVHSHLDALRDVFAVRSTVALVVAVFREREQRARAEHAAAMRQLFDQLAGLRGRVERLEAPICRT
jgi:DNA-binding CsgD family transcriptional regulator